MNCLDFQVIEKISVILYTPDRDILSTCLHLTTLKRCPHLSFIQILNTTSCSVLTVNTLFVDFPQTSNSFLLQAALIDFFHCFGAAQ